MRVKGSTEMRENLIVNLGRIKVVSECWKNFQIKKLMKAIYFPKFKKTARKTILWARNINCFTIFLLKNFWKKYHSKQ